MNSKLFMAALLIISFYKVDCMENNVPPAEVSTELQKSLQALHAAKSLQVNAHNPSLSMEDCEQIASIALKLLPPSTSLQQIHSTTYAVLESYFAKEKEMRLDVSQNKVGQLETLAFDKKDATEMQDLQSQSEATNS